MPRIVAGTARGRRLAVAPGDRVRPTSDRAREGLFNTLATLVDLPGARFADLYAGSGAVGLEALSRGAEHVLLVDSDPVAARVLKANVDVVGLPGAEIVRSSVEGVVDAIAGEPYEVVFLDPPYAIRNDALTDLVRGISERGWLATTGVCVVERPSRGEPFRWPPGLIADRHRRYGEGTLWYGFGS
ncbi:MAG: 16S rRNA (guanine(966)-N(2))-methyltransferase RsmD [Frankia sp.]